MAPPTADKLKFDEAGPTLEGITEEGRLLKIWFIVTSSEIPLLKHHKVGKFTKFKKAEFTKKLNKRSMIIGVTYKAEVLEFNRTNNVTFGIYLIKLIYVV